MRTARRMFVGMLVSAIIGASPAFAHSIVVDGNLADWFGSLPASTNLAQVSRATPGQGEWVWRDADHDELPALTAAANDLVRLGVTGDPFGMSVHAVLRGPAPLAGAGAPQLQLAIDLDRFIGIGGQAFAFGADLSVAPEASYERLLVTRFGSMQNPVLRDGAGNPVAATIPSALSADGTIELMIPWSALGLSGPPLDPLRLTAALFVSQSNDSTQEVGDAFVADAADVVTQYGDPGLASNTADETADQSDDAYFDVHFDRRGEVRAPIAIVEVLQQTPSDLSWIEVSNVGDAVVSLANWKLGDEETPDDTEAMARFPSGSLLSPGQTLIVATNGAAFRDEYGFGADAEFENHDPGTRDMLPFKPWASGTDVALSPAGDHVLLLDGSNTVVDVVVFKNASWPGVDPYPPMGSSHSIQRHLADGDTDDCVADFAEFFTPTPGIPPEVTDVPKPMRPNRGVVALGPARPSPARGSVSLTATAPSGTHLEAIVLDLSGRRVRELGSVTSDAFGRAEIRWDGRTDGGTRVPAGMYLVRVASPGSTASRRVVQID